MPDQLVPGARGLIPASQAQQAQMPPGAGQQPPMPQGGVPLDQTFPGTYQASPEEEELFEQTVAVARQATFEDKTMDRIVQLTLKSEDPARGVGQASANIAFRTWVSAQENGQPVDPAMMVAVGREIVEDAIDVVEAAGVKPFTSEDAERAFIIGVDAFRVMAQEAGMVDPNAVAQDMKMIGALDKMPEVQQAVAQYDAEVQEGP
jgi:hypothetical protein